MSTSPADLDDSLGQGPQPSPCAKDEGLHRALSSIPDFPLADATDRRPVDRKGNDQAQSATRPTALAQESRVVRACDRDVKWPQTTVSVLPEDRQIHRLRRGNQSSPRGSIRVVPSRGYVGPGMPTPMLRRPGYTLPGVKKLLVTSAMAATLAGAVVVEILDLVDDSGLPRLPQFMSHPAPSPQAASSPAELAAATTGGEAEPANRSLSMEPNALSQPAAQSENQPAGTRIEATLPVIVPHSEYEKIAGKTAAISERPAIATPQLTPILRPEPSAIATPELTPIARPEPAPIATPKLTPIARPEPAPMATPEPPAFATSEPAPNARLMPAAPATTQARLHIGNAVLADRPGFLFADSNVRYLTRDELQRLPADRLHIARNEIFARRGRYFKDDRLHVYFSQFPWYRPRSWDVPLSPVEQANIELIQSIEAPAAMFRSITAPLPAHIGAENRVALVAPGLRHLTPEELQGLSADELAIVRNEIYARRGRYFKDDALRAYFSQFPWYQPHAWDVPLGPIEQANLKLVQSFEQAASIPRPTSRAWRFSPE